MDSAEGLPQESLTEEEVLAMARLGIHPDYIDPPVVGIPTTLAAGTRRNE